LNAEGSPLAGDLIDELCSEGIAVWDRFLSAPQVSALRSCAQSRRERGDFRAACIGTDRRLQRRPDIRGDSISWLTHAQFPAESALLDELERLRLRLSRDALPGLFDLEIHYAWYPPGAGYARHVDQPVGRDQRRVSLVLYLNEDWTPGDGGALRLFAEGERFRDIEPLCGRLVLFLTDQRAHAVMPTSRDRLSLAGWFRSRDSIPG
jgi:SM-20-related protein